MGNTNFKISYFITYTYYPFKTWRGYFTHYAINNAIFRLLGKCVNFLIMKLILIQINKIMTIS